MSVLATKLLCRHGSKLLWKIPNTILRMSSGCDNCPPPPCQVPPPKTGDMPCIPEAPEPPPCPTLNNPPCPSPLCTLIPDPANPCNYCPPVCADPQIPDLVKLKKNQCHFQQDDGLPIFLKGGNNDTLLFQTTFVLVILGLAYGVFMAFTKGR